jgi:hypothetical protein
MNLNIKEFENNYLKKINFKSITYENFIDENNNLIYDINSLLNEVNNSDTQYINITEKNIFEQNIENFINRKQNVLDMNTLNDDKYWID